MIELLQEKTVKDLTKSVFNKGSVDEWIMIASKDPWFSGDDREAICSALIQIVCDILKTKITKSE